MPIKSCTDAISPTASNAPHRIGCVVMASGMGKRFGGNKLLADFCSKPLVCYTLEATNSLFQERVVVTRHRDVATLCEAQSVPVLLHDLPLRSDTVRLGLTTVGEVDGCVFCPADQPLLSSHTLSALLRAAADHPDAIWRPECKGVPGSPVYFPSWAFPELLHLPEGKGGGHVIKLYPERVRTFSVTDPFELMDVDTPEDLARLLSR